ncbi:MAG: translation initiation factor IF-2 subunit alpha [Candidatus Thalassarchaeaceae archaeon]|nr:translation initiation factor IF-2 subunit alpha [Candidatus Thalassarchaeaceae archaeon]
MKGTEYMTNAEDPWPEEGELLVCSVKNVKENGAYLNLDGYGNREGFVFIGEVAAGWVRNIRNHLRVGQRVVAKVIGIKKDRERVDLSIKTVSEERRRDTLQSWKNEQRARQIMNVAAERIGWDENKTTDISEEMIEIFGTLYGALEECAISETALSDNGFSGNWMTIVIELAIENIVPPFVEIRGKYNIEVWGDEGVYAIRDALLAAEAVAEGVEDTTLTCHYDGAPEYRIDIKAPDYETAEKLWQNAQDAVTKSITSVDGSIDIERM